MPKQLLPMALLVLAGAAHAQETTRYCFNGYGYTLDGGELRYIEHHEQVLVDGAPLRWDVTYYDTQGNVVATKHLDFSDHGTVPVYTFKIPADGYVEGITHEDGWTMFRREGRQAERESEGFEITMPMAADSGFHPLVQRHFEELMAGETVEFEFAVSGRQSVLDLRAEKVGTTTFEGEPAVVLRAELDMFLINFFVDPLLLTYDPQSKRLLEYRGIGNLHNAQGEVYPVRVSYYSEMPTALRGSGVPTGCTAGKDLSVSVTRAGAATDGFVTMARASGP